MQRAELVLTQLSHKEIHGMTGDLAWIAGEPYAWKLARTVRRERPGNLPRKRGKAPGLYSTSSSTLGPSVVICTDSIEICWRATALPKVKRKYGVSSETTLK